MRQKTINHTDAQRAAVVAPVEGATRVTAGAGTGKTSVLVSRYVKLMRDDGIVPERILALTFTLKAAAEMRHRIEEAVRKELPDLSSRLHSAWIMNFHQFGYRLIKENAPLFGIDPDAGVVSSTDFKRIERHLAARFAAGDIAGVPMELARITAPTQLENRFNMFFRIANRCRAEMVSLPKLLETVRESGDEMYRTWLESIVAISDAHNQELVRRNLIDFSDMIIVPARGLREHASLRDRYLGRFDHILVDEFQDTSTAQNELLRILSGGDFSRVTVVGDEKQAIYRWRDAKVENIRNFPGSSRPLCDNFRSYQQILDLAHAFIARDPDFKDAETHGPLNASRGAAPHPVVVFHPPGDSKGKALPNARELEAEALATWVRCLLTRDRVQPLPDLGPDERLEPDEVTVLLRSLNERCSRPEIEAAFEKHAIPYAIIGGANAAETRALELLHAWMSILLPAVDVRELLTVLERDPFRVPDAALLELFGTRVKRHSAGHDWLATGEINRVTDPAVRDTLAQLRSIRDELQAQWRAMEFRQFVDFVLTESPVLLRLFEDQVLLETVEDLIGEVHELVDSLALQNELNLPAFLEHLRVAVDERKFREEGDLRFPPGRVRIMTIHQSKGLEFRAVAVAGIKPPRPPSDGFFLSKQDGIFFSADEMKERGRGYKDTAEKAGEERLDRQENRCLHYVAMTRARDLLWVSSPNPPKGPNKDGELKEDLFRDIVECAAEVEGVVVLHEVQSLEGKITLERDARDAPDPGALRSTLERRAEVRSALAASLAAGADALPEPLSVNWSGLAAFDVCPRQFHYRVLNALGGLTTGGDAPVGDAAARNRTEGDDDLASIRIPKGIDPASYGVFVHRALEEWSARPQAKPEDIVSALAKESGYSGDGLARAASRLVGAVKESKECRPGDDVRAEEPFQVRRSGITFHGILDRFERGPDGWLITDYKIGTPKEDYAFQVCFYAWAVEHIVGEPVGGRLVYVREDGVKIEKVTSADGVARIGKVADRLATAVDASAFAASPGEPCADCSYRGVCPSAQVAGAA